MARAPLILVLLCLAAVGCAPAAAPPRELTGLWSGNPVGCALGAGIRFEAGAIALVHEEQKETLFARPRYVVERAGDDFQVRVTYDLPRLAGGAHDPGARGVLVLARRPDGALAPVSHIFLDGRTGAARLRIADDPAAALMTLAPCSAHPWREALRGRSDP